MLCKICGNKTEFLVMITDYKPIELWTFKDGLLTRYTKKDEEAGYLDVKIQCPKCGADTKDIDKEGFNFVTYAERPLIVLSEDDWLEKEKNFRKAPSIDDLVEEIEKEEAAEEESEDMQNSSESTTQEKNISDQKATE